MIRGSVIHIAFSQYGATYELVLGSNVLYI
jgi:hypothetical protein